MSSAGEGESHSSTTLRQPPNFLGVARALESLERQRGQRVGASSSAARPCCTGVPPKWVSGTAVGISGHRGAGEDRAVAARMAQGLEKTGTPPCKWVLPEKLARRVGQHAGRIFGPWDSAIAQLRAPSPGCIQGWLPSSQQGQTDAGRPAPSTAQSPPASLWGGERTSIPA